MYLFPCYNIPRFRVEFIPNIYPMEYIPKFRVLIYFVVCSNVVKVCSSILSGMYNACSNMLSSMIIVCSNILS